MNTPDLLILVNDTTHTPGPWKATMTRRSTAPLDPYGQWTLTDNWGDGVARVLRADRSEFAVVNERETRLNASLLAAAPDLLAIVAELARHDGMSGDLPMLIVKARAALAKATTTTQE